MNKFLIIVLFLLPFQSHAAIAFDAVTNGSGGVGSSLTVSHTVTGSNPVLVACAFVFSPAGTISATYNGVSMTLDSGSPANDGSPVQTFMFYLFGPATGTHNLVFSETLAWSEINTSETSYTGVSQAGTLDSHSKTENTSPTTSITLTTTVVTNNSWTIGCARNEAGNATDGAGTTHRGVQNDHSIFDSNGALASGSQSLIQNFSSAANAGIIISVAPFAAVAQLTSILGLVRSWWLW